MTILAAALLDEVLAACQANAAEAAAALGRAWGGSFDVSAEAAETYAPEIWPAGGPPAGLAIVLHVGSTAAVLCVPEATGLLPEWYAAPDATGESKLGALAQELGMLLLPDALAAERTSALRVESLAASLAEAEVAADAAVIRLRLVEAAGKEGDALLVWPVAKPAALALASGATPSAESPAAPLPSGATSAPAAETSTSREFRALPGYSRSLLRVQVPVSVRLAEKRESIREIVELAPGAILKFDKSCDELLQLYVGDCAVAEGEAVKVGDKFGFRVRAMLMPRERFEPVRPRRQQAG